MGHFPEISRPAHEYVRSFTVHERKRRENLESGSDGRRMKRNGNDVRCERVYAALSKRKEERCLAHLLIALFAPH